MAQITTATAGDVVRDKRVMITANKSNTIAEVLDIMLKKKVLTVPVFDSVQSRHYSMLSMHRIIGFILNFDHGSGDSVDVGRLNKNVDELISLTLADAVFEEFDEKAPFDEILAALAKGTFNRAMVKTGEECRLLTHTDAASFLLQTPEKIPTGSIKDFGFLCSVTTCSDRETGLACFRKLHRAQLSACPIVNRDGAVIGNISTSDMRNIDPMHFNGIMLKTVAVNVLDFLRGQHGGEVPAPISCKATDSLVDVMRMCVQKHIHRVWVCDEQMQPHGVATLTGMIRCCLGVSPLSPLPPEP